MPRPLNQVRECLGSWLQSKGPSVVLVCDSPRDLVQLRHLFPEGLPTNVSCKVLGWWGNFSGGSQIAAGASIDDLACVFTMPWMMPG
jgi:hypothetical protein